MNPTYELLVVVKAGDVLLHPEITVGPVSGDDLARWRRRYDGRWAA
jgi:hypothetical protein